MVAVVLLTRHSRRNSAAKSCDSCHGDLLGGVLLGTGMPGSHHVGLEQSALQVDMVVRQGLVHSSQNLLGHILAPLQIMFTIRQNFRLHDWHNAMLMRKGVRQE